jgi:hypothetical protein
MNDVILELAANYVNSYRDGCDRRGMEVCKTTLRGHVGRKFGPVYAALLIQ